MRQQGWITEAQLRAAAAVASKRADDEALHAEQKLAKLHTLDEQCQVRLSRHLFKQFVREGCS